MRRLATPLALALVLSLAASAAQAQSIAPSQRRVRYTAGGAVCAAAPASCRVLAGVAANAATGLRTFRLKTEGLAKLTVQVDLVRTAATDVRLSCSASLSDASTFGRIASTAIAAGTGTVSAYTDVYATTSTGGIVLEYDVRTYDWVECTATATSGGANDTVTVYAIGSV
jgi:hypothetical protein